jgi:hypothetical protein
LGRPTSIPLPVIADRLEDSGEPGLAAGVRFVQYLADTGIGLDPPLSEENPIRVLGTRAGRYLESLVEDGMARSLFYQFRDIHDYGRVLT